MPLPQPTYPPVVPQTFLTAKEDRLLSMGLELYARYHPGAMQQQMYQTLLEDETWQAAQASEKMKRLTTERQRLVDMRTQLQAARATGGTVSGSGRRTSGGSSSAWTGLSKPSVDLYLGTGKLTQAAKDDVYRKYDITPTGRYLVDDILNKLDGLGAKGGFNNSTLRTAIEAATEASRNSPKSPLWTLERNSPEMRALVSSLWAELKTHPQFEQMNTYTADLHGRTGTGGVAGAIDDYFDTGRWISSIVDAGGVPGYELQAEMNAALAGKTPSDFPKDLDGDGTITAEERQAAAAKDPERLFESRIRSLDAQIGAQERRSSPMARAARRTLGRPAEPERGPDELPYVSPENLQAAAAAGGNIAAEALPYAMRRVQQGKGTIEPKDAAESWAQSWLEQNKERSFPQFVEQMNKKFDGTDAEKNKLTAAAYYGAFYYNHDLKSQTLNRGMLNGNVQEASDTAAKQFQQDAAQDPSVGAGTALAPQGGAMLAPDVSVEDLLPGHTGVGSAMPAPGQWPSGRDLGIPAAGMGINPTTNAPWFMADWPAPAKTWGVVEGASRAPAVASPAQGGLFGTGRSWPPGLPEDPRDYWSTAGGVNPFFSPGGYIESPLRSAVGALGMKDPRSVYGPVHHPDTSREYFLDEAGVPVEYENEEEEVVAFNPSAAGSEGAPWKPPALSRFITPETHRSTGSNGWVYDINRSGIRAYHQELAPEGRWIPSRVLRPDYRGGSVGADIVPFAQTVALDILQNDPKGAAMLQDGRHMGLTPSDIEGLQEIPKNIRRNPEMYFEPFRYHGYEFGYPTYFDRALPSGHVRSPMVEREEAIWDPTTRREWDYSPEFTTSSYSPEILGELAQQYGVTVPEVIEILGASTR